MSCKKCGNCCSKPKGFSLSESEIRGIEDYTNLSRNAFSKQSTIPGEEDMFILSNNDSRCYFLNGKSECNVYSARPVMCKAFDCITPKTEIRKKYLQLLEN